MSERVKVDAGQVEARGAWLMWVCEPEFTYTPDWASIGLVASKQAAMKNAVEFSEHRKISFLVARYIGDPEAVVVSREYPEGVPVEWTGGEGI